jgi:hypothetical protein
MMLASPTNYNSLPPMPQISALPQGIPSGPWGPLYRSAPGAQLPAVRYSGMQGGLGRSPVTLVGSGLGSFSSSPWLSLGLAALISAGVGAAYAKARDSRRPVLYPSLVLGGVTLFSGIMSSVMNRA